MRAINHSLTGALIGLTVADPLIAAPIALASHYVLDAIPHFELPRSKRYLVSGRFIALLILDAFLCTALVAILIVSRPAHWISASICAFLAAAPDFLSIKHFYYALKKRKWHAGLYSKFASKIQWFERPSGIVVEAAWLAGAIFCLSFFIHR